MITFNLNNKEYENDLLELVRLFEPRFTNPLELTVDYVLSNNILVTKVSSNKFINFSKTYRHPIEYTNEIEKKRNIKIYLKVAIYNTLAFLTEINLPYGCLTGVRPTKFFRDLGEKGRDYFTNLFSVEDKKVELIKSIVDLQDTMLSKPNEVDLFIFIPFCPTRCKYCSFVSESIQRTLHLVEPYMNCLLRELQLIPSILKANKAKVRSIYIGGGTPTALPPDQLERLLNAIKHDGQEYTVEAGRPETLTDEIISILSTHGVNRISINPQTFNDRTLKTIGRLHSSKDIDMAYNMARDKFNINMDLIAMLPNESFYDFKYSIDKAIYYQPANLTVHTLYKKRAAEIDMQIGYEEDILANKMIDYSQNILKAKGYNAYYMYRQKYTGGCLENVGYAKPDKECLYNIDIMEENTNVIAFGAGSISKKIDFDKKFISRCPHVKNPYDYIERIDEIISRQKAFWIEK